MPKIIINEIYRGSNLTTGDEFIELLLVEDLTAAELNNFFVGDSTASKAEKHAAYQFTSTGAIAPTFQAGTLIVVGGSGQFTEDTSYNPAGDDWAITLITSGTFLSNANGNAGDFAANDVAWVDTISTGATLSADGFAIDIGSAIAPLTSVANVDLGDFTNNTGAALIDGLAGVATLDHWLLGIASGSTTPGQPNGDENTTYINGLRHPIGPLPQPDLTVDITTPASLTVSTPFAYTLDVQNMGTATADGVILSFTLPTGVTYNSATVLSGGFGAPTVLGSTLIFSNGSITSGNEAQIDVYVTPTQAGTLGSAALTADPENAIAESDETNNSNTTGTLTVQPEAAIIDNDGQIPISQPGPKSPDPSTETMGTPVEPIRFQRDFEENDTFQGTPGDDMIHGNYQQNKIAGGRGNDCLFGGRFEKGCGPDLLYGGSGDDHLDGGQGGDYLDGGKGRDRILGGGGRDILVGGLGADKLTGGRGKDMYVYQRLRDGGDRITDFNTDMDVIDLRPLMEQSAFRGVDDFSRFSQFIQFEQVSQDTQVRIDADGYDSDTLSIVLAVLQGVDADALSAYNLVL